MNALKSISSLFLLAAVVSGCAKLAHLQELLTMKAYSDEKDAQVNFVRQQDEKFKTLLDLAEGQGLGAYTTRERFLTEFGEPILRKDIIKDGRPREEWLYRYSTQYFDSPKVYLYFDEQGVLQSWDYVPGKKKT